MSENTQQQQSEIRNLVAALGHFSSRAAARRRLVLIGEPAVPALIEALESPIEGVAWSAATTLGDIRAEEAVEALERALSSPEVADAARIALTRITGQDHSGAADSKAARSTAAATAGMLSDEELARALSSRTVSCRSHSTGCSITVELPRGRTQKVEMMLSLKDSDGEPLVAFYTECGTGDPERYEWALKANLRIPFGAFALRETSSGAKLVMVDAYLRGSTTVRQLARAVEMLARHGDDAEKMISQGTGN